ncbi:undecaprenyl-phosphate alpha-N-acetylglucosaminyl 1-phosphate transferase [Rhodanobacter panaciterrae]|uniref:Undecaprenyl-phosphate alpha-N-acetylglucosaminyl 1-phosphate transferase n=1 Tax=Rhodanobacter panaciterrae TaxID=490572 RepID=A0ABQ2ZYZ6_9GAMM|nr:undecaprenyl/decaprenyl-phosphate alpha-N-acetylglucosaminyl 1-phosphate transferase [Rhodanobacter panaciterrae]GGY27403.1 undecaprenyl-phosphate alpha-N-acetylglucosaminyl 1-phosphate transferase [Rhodanobacter panaciterrae]
MLRRFAPTLGLVDHPNERKHHVGSVPLVGGVAIFIGVLAGALSYGQFHTYINTLLGTAGMLVLLGALDDRFDLRVRIRVLVQTMVILIVIANTGVYIHTLGHIFGYQVELGWSGIPITVIAVIGLLNAFNMMDGIDGLAGSLALVSIAAIVLFAGTTPLRGSLALVGLLAAAALPYLAANLGFMGRKIFLGDAGSMVIGYLLAWTLIRLSQAPGTHLSPVDVLWCVALPVLDTLAVMYRRLRQGKSPFKPDRGHIHHILMGAGLGPRATLIALVALAASIAFLGSVVRSLPLGSGSNLAAFCIFMVVYIAIVERTWLRQRARRNHFIRHSAANDAHVFDFIRTPFRKPGVDNRKAITRGTLQE